MVVVGIYLPSVSHGFLYDDYEVILSNAPLRSIEDLGRILTERHFLSLPYYRPVVRSSLLLQRTLHGDQPGPFHLFNAFVAGWIALVAYALLRLPVFGLRTRWAFLAAAVFALHPVASSCVYPIASGRETLLPALFVLLALYCFLRPGPRWRLAAAVFFALALFGKEQAVVTLAIFVLADGLGLTSAAPGLSLRRWLGRYWPEAAIGALYFSIRHFLFAGGEYRLGDLGQFALSYLYALQVVTVPFWELVYEPPAPVWFSPWRLAIGLAITGWALWWIRRSWPQVRAVTWFWLGWFLLTLLPTANLLDQEAPFAERYVFLSALSPIFLLAWILSNRENGGRQKRWTGLAVAVLLLLATQTVARGAFFRDYEVFCRQWVKTDPKSLNAHNSLAVVLTMDGRLKEAGGHYEEALKLRPTTLKLTTIWPTCACSREGSPRPMRCCRNPCAWTPRLRPPTTHWASCCWARAESRRPFPTLPGQSACTRRTSRRMPTWPTRWRTRATPGKPSTTTGRRFASIRASPTPPTAWHGFWPPIPIPRYAPALRRLGWPSSSAGRPTTPTPCSWIPWRPLTPRSDASVRRWIRRGGHPPWLPPPANSSWQPRSGREWPLTGRAARFATPRFSGGPPALP